MLRARFADCQGGHVSRRAGTHGLTAAHHPPLLSPAGRAQQTGSLCVLCVRAYGVRREAGVCCVREYTACGEKLVCVCAMCESIRSVCTCSRCKEYALTHWCVCVLCVRAMGSVCTCSRCKEWDLQQDPARAGHNFCNDTNPGFSEACDTNGLSLQPTGKKRVPSSVCACNCGRPFTFCYTFKNAAATL